MRNVLFLILLSLAAPVCLAQTLASPLDAGSAPTSTPKKPVSFDLSAIDKTADPCTDFYQYVCGNWKKDNPIPADQVRWGRFNELADRNNYLLYKDLKAASDAPKTPLQKQYGDYFAACMNTEVVDKLGAQPLQIKLRFRLKSPCDGRGRQFEHLPDAAQTRGVQRGQWRRRQRQQLQRQIIETLPQLRPGQHMALSAGVRQQCCSGRRRRESADMAVAQLHQLGLNPRQQRLVTLEQRAAAAQFKPQQRLVRGITDQAAPLIGPCGQAVERFALDEKISFAVFAVLAGGCGSARDRLTSQLR